MFTILVTPRQRRWNSTLSPTQQPTSLLLLLPNALRATLHNALPNTFIHPILPSEVEADTGNKFRQADQSSGHSQSPPAAGPSIEGPDDSTAGCDLSTKHESGNRKLGLDSKLSSIGTMLEVSRTSSASAATAPVSVPMISLKMLATSEVRRRLDLFFAEIDLVLPIMERSDMSERLFSLLRDWDVSETADCVVHLSVDKVPLAALLCVILATAELFSFEPTPTIQSKPPGWAWVVHAQTLLQHFEEVNRADMDMDVLRCYTLMSFYLMATGSFEQASEAIGVAAQLAIASQLNVQHTLLYGERGEARRHRRLWWAINWMDQKVSRICGIPYWIRDQEIAIDDISVTNLNPSDSQDQRLYDSPTTDAAVLDFSQLLMHLARVNRKVWDRQFSPRQSIALDRAMAANIDSQLLQLISNLPAHLAWRRMRLEHYRAAESEHAIWRRLIISNVSQGPSPKLHSMACCSSTGKGNQLSPTPSPTLSAATSRGP